MTPHSLKSTVKWMALFFAIYFIQSQTVSSQDLSSRTKRILALSESSSERDRSQVNDLQVFRNEDHTQLKWSNRHSELAGVFMIERFDGVAFQAVGSVNRDTDSKGLFSTSSVIRWSDPNFTSHPEECYRVVEIDVHGQFSTSNLAGDCSGLQPQIAAVDFRP